MSTESLGYRSCLRCYNASMSLYRRGRIYWSRIQWRGQVLQRTTRTANRTTAIQIEAAWRTQLAKGEVGLSDHTLHSPTLEAFTAQFLAYLPAHVAPRTVAFYADAWRSLTGFTPLASARLSHIDVALVERYIQNRRAAGLMPATINNGLRSLRRGLHLAQEWKLLQKVPKITMLPGERNREFVLSEDLLLQFVNAAKGTTFALLLFVLYDSGLRLSEALSLTWAEVSFEPKADAARGFIYVAKGKSKYAKRYVPLTGRARACLAECRKLSTSQWVFTASDGKNKLSRHWASEQFRQIRDSLGLPWDCVVHSCRHSFLTRLGEAGADAFTIQRLAGHSSIVISQKYVHPTPARLESVIGLLENRVD